MKTIRNEQGTVLVFVTLMVVLLMIMVGMGLDTGHLAYIRSQGQPAVDAAALAAAMAIPTGEPAKVGSRAAEFNHVKGSNDGGNNYLNSPNNQIDANNVTLINYDQSRNPPIVAASGVSSTSTGDANGVRVALEDSNPYGGPVGAAMKSPLFLTPLFNLFGQKTKGTQNVSVSAVAVIQAVPGMPIAISGCAPSNAGCTGGDGSIENPYTDCRLLQVSSGKGDPTNQDSGWTTFNIKPANAPNIKALVGNGATCGNIPSVNIGSGCIYLNNGQIIPILTEFEKVYSPNGYGPAPADCGIVPVVRAAIPNFNGCEPVESFARFCIKDVVKNDSGTHYLRGDLVCDWDINKVGGTDCYTAKLVRDQKSGM
jgi:Flp pilus assembly protein TadG